MGLSVKDPVETTSPSQPAQPNEPLPQTSEQPSTTAQQPSNPPSTAPPNASALPPAALALAAKLFDQARTGSTTSLEEYIRAGIPVNLTNHEGNTLLMLAAYHGHAGTTSMLIGLGADVDFVNNRGQTPLAGAVFKGYDEVAKVLVEEGKADPRKGTPTAIDTAKMFRRDEMLKLFGVPESEWRDMPGDMILPGPPTS